MKKLLLVITTLLALTAKSQTSVYHPFPDSSAMWCDYWMASNSGCLSVGRNTYEMYAQSIINGITYSNIRYYRYSYYCGFGTITDTGTFYIRQDIALKKVWAYVPSSNSDTIFFDFDLQIGDTLNQKQGWAMNYQAPDYWIVSSIDSILIDGNYRKQFHYARTTAPTCFQSMIEGIGADHGFNQPTDCFEYWPSLLKAFQNGILLYGDSSPVTSSCHDFTLGVTEIKSKELISIFPNPVTDKLNVAVSNKELSEIILYDITSRKLLQQNFTNSVSINTEQLSKGVYLYEVRCGSILCKQGKLVKD